MNRFSISKLPSDVLKDIAEKCRQLRKESKMSQAELAERSGVSHGSVKRFERTGKISFESLLKLAHILGRLSEFESLFLQKEDLSKIEKLFSDKTRNK